MLLRLLNSCLIASTLAFVGCSTSPTRTAPAAPLHSVEGIHEYRLDNGLQVLLVPDASKPTTTVNVTYRVGSRHENYGETGMAHLLEHLLFKGTPSHPEVWSEFTKRGLRANGTTSFDRTNYFASFAANPDNLKWYLDWQADAMVNSFIARKDLDTEMTVVRNEMEMGENNPGRMLFQKTVAVMYDWHNYGKSTIGARSDVENVDIKSLQAFYRLYYQPDNATLVISGKFDREQVLAWIDASFGKIPKPTRELPRLYTLDPVQSGERSMTLRRVGGTPMLMAAYHLPPAAHPDFAAAEALALILSTTPSGRLHKQLVETRLASSIFAEPLGLADPGFALIGADLAPGQDPDKARDALLAVIEGFAESPVTQEELDRAKTQWLKAWDQQFTNPEAIGVALSGSIAQGDWRLFFLLRDRVQALTLADVQRVATERLIRSNRTLGTYLPTAKPVRAPTPAAVDVAEQLKTFVPKAGADAIEAFDTSPAHVEASTQRFTLPSGLEAALLAKPTRGQAGRATLTLRFGDEKSLAGKTSVGAMVAALLDKGTTSLSRQQIQDRLDALRTEVSVADGPGSVSFGIVSRREHIAEAIALVGQMAREPVFPQAAMAEVRQQTLTAIEQQRDEPRAIVQNALLRHDNPYPRGDVRHARTFDEIVADVQAVTPAQVQDYHRRFYGASDAQFAAVGDFDPAAVRQALQAAFGPWKSPSPYTRVPRPFFAPDATRMVMQTPDKQNAVLGVQQHVPLNDTDADYAAFALANFMLGSGGDSRLWKRIRERDGLSYGTWSSVDWNPFEANSLWAATAIYAPQNRDKVEQAFREEVALALKEGFTDQEVANAKQALLSYRRLGRAQDERLATTLSSHLYLDRDFAFEQRVDEAIEAVTPAQANAALRKYLQPETFVFGLAGDFKKP